MEFVIRKVARRDNPGVAKIIRSVMTEFGAVGPGFAIVDTEVDDIYGAYTREDAAYFVCEHQGKLLGGGGIAMLSGGDGKTCELKKMYFLPESRGKGLGQKVLTQCLTAAKEIGYKNCYLETFNTMKTAMKLYEKNGFEKIGGSMGNTGHFSVDNFYCKKL